MRHSKGSQSPEDQAASDAALPVADLTERTGLAMPLAGDLPARLRVHDVYDEGGRLAGLEIDVELIRERSVPAKVLTMRRPNPKDRRR
jgi:hypothetical protein